MIFRHSVAIALASATAAACASTSASKPAPSGSADQTATVYPTLKRWSGTLKPTMSFNGAAVASQRQNAYGTVTLTVSPSTPTLSRVELTVAVPNEPGLDMVGWAVSEGRCGSGNPPVLSPSSFQPIQLNASGKGSVNIQIPFVVPDQGTYHVNVFRGTGNQLNDVLTCGELRMES